MALPDRLREATRLYGVGRLARMAGVSDRQLRRLLAGQSKCGPRSDTIQAIARAAGLDPAYLAFGGGEREGGRQP